MVTDELTTRADFAAEAIRLRDAGTSHEAIADRFRVSKSTVRSWLYDPDGSKHAARKRSCRGQCEKCGTTTSADSKRQVSKLCAACARTTAPHGTLTRYQYHGCRCDECRRANREKQAALKGKPAPTHSVSGYRNYGCRCDVCREAHAHAERIEHSGWRYRRNRKKADRAA